MLRRNILFGLSIILSGILCATVLMMAAADDVRVANAAMKGDKDAVRALVKQAVDVNAAQGDGMTALHWAALNNDAELAQMLLYAGANVRATTRIGGYTPLFMAAKGGAAPVIDALLKAGADPKTKGTDGLTALMMAAMAGNRESVRLLLEHGADVDAKESEHGQTPLIFAAAFDRPDVIEELARHGADLNLATVVQAPVQQGRGGGGGQGQGQQPALVAPAAPLRRRHCRSSAGRRWPRQVPPGIEAAVEGNALGNPPPQRRQRCRKQRQLPPRLLHRQTAVAQSPSSRNGSSARRRKADAGCGRATAATRPATAGRGRRR